jgi:hypothetical protein
MSNSPEAAVAATADITVTDFIPISTDANKHIEPSSPSILVPALPQMEPDEATHNAATTPNATSTNDAVGPTLYVGLCLPLEAFLSTVNSYLEKHKVQCNFDRSAPRKQQPDNKYYRWRCKRGGKYDSKSTGQRPNRISIKCDCKMVINASHPKKKEGWDTTTLVLKKLSLEHTDGCNGGADEDMNMLVLRRSGRKYPDHVLNSLREDVKAGRYGTNDVRSKLVDFGLSDVSIEEATNLRYRLMKDLPIRGWESNDENEETQTEMRSMQDYLFNADIASEIKAGGREGIEKLQILLNGLKAVSPGFDFDIATDTEGRFTGTAWMSGRMRARLAKFGDVLFIDDTRSGITSSGFSFWNVMVVNCEGKILYGMGAMTMTHGDDAVDWVLKSLVNIFPGIQSVAKTTMSDLGEHTSMVKPSFHPGI